MRSRGTAVGGHEPRAVQKALALLEAVAELGSGAAAKDIAAHTGIAPATAYRLLNLLVADGYLVRLADLSGFALGIRTRQLATAAEPDSEDRAQILGELRDQVRYGIFLTAYTETGLRFTDRDPDHELGGESTITTHLHASAVGKLLLADRRELVVAPLRRLTAHTVTDPVALAEELDVVGALGTAREVDETRIGRSAVAVAVRSGGPQIAGALTAIGRTGRLAVDDPGLVDLLRTYAQRLGAVRLTSPPTSTPSPPPSPTDTPSPSPPD